MGRHLRIRRLLRIEVKPVQPAEREMRPAERSNMSSKVTALPRAKVDLRRPVPCNSGTAPGHMLPLEVVLPQSSIALHHVRLKRRHIVNGIFTVVAAEYINYNVSVWTAAVMARPRLVPAAHTRKLSTLLRPLLPAFALLHDWHSQVTETHWSWSSISGDRVCRTGSLAASTSVAVLIFISRRRRTPSARAMSGR